MKRIENLKEEIIHEAIFPEEPEIPGITEPPGHAQEISIDVATPLVADQSGMSKRLIVVFAIACGLVVANNYYAQPILDVISRAFAVSTGVAGLVVTLTQIGYALGLILVVPLGDLVDRRRLITTVLVATTLALVGSALAPSIAALIAVAFLLGFTTVVAQVLVPFAATLASPAERGQVVGTVMSGLLLGILLARTVSGLVSQVAGWRAVYGLAAVLTIGLILVLGNELPRMPESPVGLTRASYSALLRSVGALIRDEPLLRRRSAYGALTFAAFSVFWTSAAFLLSHPPYDYNQAIIGLFGLLGAAGAATASVAGRFADRGWARFATGGFLAFMFASYGLLALGGNALFPLIAGVIALDLGAQGTHITNQSEIYRLRPEARSRITTAYMTSYFVGGALGSATSAAAYGSFGWLGVCAIGGSYGAIALLIWLTELF